MNRLLFILLLLLPSFLISIKGYSQINTVDPTFNPTDSGFGNGDGFNNGLSDLVVQPDGNVITVGAFTSYSGTSANRIARLNTNGNLDTTLDPGNILNNANILCVTLQADGKILVGGFFNLKRLNANGSLDTTFNSIGGGTTYCCAVQSDGKILIGGTFVHYNGTPINRIARLNQDGTLDTTFHVGTGVNGDIYSIVIQPDGKILIGGVFNQYNGVTKNKIARLNTDGTLDPTFGASANDNLYGMVIQPDGKIVIVGAFTTYGGISRNRVARLNSDGTLDTTFIPGTGANTFVLDAKLQPDGKILIGGVFSTYNGVSRNRIARLNSDGSLDLTFNPGTGADVNILSVALQSDGKILVGGTFTTFNGKSRKYLVRLNSDGTLEDSFTAGTGSNSTIYSFCTQPDGKIVVGGAFTNYNGTSLNRIARMNDVAALDTLFNSGSGVDSIIHMIKLQSDGKIIIGGAFTNYDGASRNRIARLNDNGSLDTLFDPGTGANGTIYGTAIQSDGKILIVGAFTNYNGVSRNRIARLNEDGTLDLTFNPGSGLDGTSYEIAVQPDGKLLVGGAFTNYNGVPGNRIVRLNSDGSLDLTFTTGIGFNGTIYEIAIQPDGKIILGGAFTAYGGTSRNRVARLNSDGTLDLVFNPGSGPNGTVYAIRLYSDGKILIGGNFTTYSGVSRNRITRLLDHGSLDVSYNPGTGANNTIYCNFIQPDDKILIAGDFTSYNGVGRNRIARLFSCYPTNNTINQTVCNSYTLNNITYTSSGMFTQTLINSAGCDSIITLNLTILSNSGIDIQTTCDSLTWIDGNTYYYSTNAPTFVLQNAVGCDSIVTLNLIVTNSNTGTDFQTACDSLIWIDGNTYYSSTNTPTFVLQNASGCDSIITLNLTITYPTSGMDIQTACDSLVWIDGNTYTASTNTPTFVLQNSTGCDSTVTLNLTILNSSAGVETQTTCSSFIWPINGQIYTTSGQYIDTIPNSVGCDSIVTLNLTILNPSNSTETQTTCSSFIWPINGQTYTSSGQYTDTIPNAAGCDSIVTLNLTIIPDLPLTIENSFSMPSDANSCTGEVAVTVSGNAPFELDFDSGSQVITSNGYSLVTGLCAGIHDLHVTDNCGDTLSNTIVIPVDSNYVFNNPFIDSLALDSLGVTLTNCDIFYAGIDTAYIDSIWANGNMVNVIWNIVDSNGSNFDTTSYVLNNGNGVYWLQLSVFCPNKSLGEYFTVTEAIYFLNGSVSTAGLGEVGTNLFEIYPNPTNDQVHINFSGSDAELTVYDAQGKVVLKNRIQNHGIVSLQNFERGVYLFDFNNSQGHSVQRVVKQ